VNVKSLREAIRTIAEFLEASGAGPRGKSLHAVHDLLEGHDDESLEEFLAGLHDRSKESKPRALASAVNDSTVASYVQRLRATGTDKSAFDQVFDELTKDKMVRKAEADAIAHAYTGGRRGWPTKRLALAAIATWFRGLAFDQTKMCRV
jgi:tryptophan 2,3-dioxygenase